jgi:hypothetical protein
MNLINKKGEELRRNVLNAALAPYAKRLAVLDAVFSGPTGIAIRIECSEPSSVLLLRGTKPGCRGHKPRCHSR